jgi:hypothetical protein
MLSRKIHRKMNELSLHFILGWMVLSNERDTNFQYVMMHAIYAWPLQDLHLRISGKIPTHP